MDINIIKKEKADLEERLLKMVSNELSAFSNKTGVNIESVDIDMRTVGIQGEPFNRIIPLHVYCEIKI